MKRLLPLFLLPAAALVWWMGPASETAHEDPRRTANPQANAAHLSSPSESSSEAPVTLAPTSRNSAPAAAAPSPQSSASLSEAIAQLLRRGDAISHDRALSLFLPQLLVRDPLEAARLIETWPPGPERDELLGALARLWSASDLRSAMAWLSTLADPDRTVAATAAVAQLRQADPAGALAVAEAFQIGIANGQLEHIAQLWTEDQPAEAIAWVKSRPASPVRDRLLARVAYARVQTDPAEALPLLDLITPGPIRDSATADLLRQWLQRDPAAYRPSS